MYVSKCDHSHDNVLETGYMQLTGTTPWETLSNSGSAHVSVKEKGVIRTVTEEAGAV